MTFQVYQVFWLLPFLSFSCRYIDFPYPREKTFYQKYPVNYAVKESVNQCTSPMPVPYLLSFHPCQ